MQKWGNKMKFTYTAYTELIRLLTEKKYVITKYDNYQDYDNCVILRHDIDMDVEKAYLLAQKEQELGIKSTYFVCVTSEHYNCYSKKNQILIKNIRDLGHTIGLHFDEMAYPDDVGIVSNVTKDIEKEMKLLSDMLEMNINAFSFHRPTKKILDANIKIQGKINAYDDVFFKEFEYVSDSRMFWRKPILDLIREKQSSRLCILTHPIWYNEKEVEQSEILTNFIKRANSERYYFLKDNFRDLDSVLEKSINNI